MDRISNLETFGNILPRVTLSGAPPHLVARVRQHRDLQNDTSHTKKTQDVGSMLGYGWVNVEDSGPSITQHWVNVSSVHAWYSIRATLCQLFPNGLRQQFIDVSMAINIHNYGPTAAHHWANFCSISQALISRFRAIRLRIF